MTDSFIYGSIGGIFQTIIGHPFDTIKTLQQTNIKLNINHLRPINLYRGVGYPLIQSPILIGATFYLNDNFGDYKKYGINYCLTGLITSFIICPFDEFKIKRQVGKKFSLYDFYKCYSNLNIVLLREIPATFIYFGTYDYFRDNKYSITLSGGMSGIVTWLFTYPIDTVKTQMQGIGLKKSNLILYKKLFNGLTICLIRAGIVNSSIFYVYEFLKNRNKN